MPRHPFAQFLGKSYAHFQHGLDQFIEWSVSKLKNAETPPSPVRATKEKAGNKYIALVGTTVRGTLGFIGTACETYFVKYRELKTSENERKAKSKPIEIVQES